MNVTVLGGGNGAFAAAGDLTLRGHQVTLCEVPAMAAAIDELRRTRTIVVNAMPGTGLPSGPATIARVTDDATVALDGAELIIVVVPAFAHAPFARFVARALRVDQPVLLMPGNLWGGFRFHAYLIDAGAPRDALVGETECMVYAARRTGPVGVAIRGYKHHLGIAWLEHAQSEEMLARVRALYPTARLLGNVVEAGLNNVNPFFHPLILLSNLGLAGLPDARRFYVDGVSAPVARLIEILDAERREVAEALEISLPTLRDLLLLWYGHEGARGESLFQVIHSVPAYQHSFFPHDVSTSRYLLEDVPFGLVPLLRLAGRAGVAAPLTGALVAHAYVVARSLGAGLSETESEPHDWLDRARSGLYP